MDLVIRDGEPVFPREVEACLARHPKVQAVRCVGVPDERHGQELCACIVLRRGEVADPAEMRAHCRGRIATRLLPRHVRFLPALPATLDGLRRQMAADLGYRVEVA
jgi:fatty-acyl-CoA synthase